MKSQLAIVEESLEPSAKLAAVHRRKSTHWKKPVRRRAGPVAVLVESAAGDDAVDVIVVHERLAPGMEDDGEPQLGIEFVATKLQQRVGCGGEKEIEAPRLILLDEGVQGMGEREDQVEIRNRQQKLRLLF